MNVNWFKWFFYDFTNDTEWNVDYIIFLVAMATIVNIFQSSSFPKLQGRLLWNFFKSISGRLATNIVEQNFDYIISLVAMATRVKIFNNLLLRNHWSDLNEIWCECSLEDSLQMIQNEILIDEKIRLPGAGVSFSVYGYKWKSLKELLRYNWSELNVNWWKYFFDDSLQMTQNGMLITSFFWLPWQP